MTSSMTGSMSMSMSIFISIKLVTFTYPVDRSGKEFESRIPHQTTNIVEENSDLKPAPSPSQGSTALSWNLQ